MISNDKSCNTKKLVSKWIVFVINKSRKRKSLPDFASTVLTIGALPALATQTAPVDAVPIDATLQVTRRGIGNRETCAGTRSCRTLEQRSPDDNKAQQKSRVPAARVGKHVLLVIFGLLIVFLEFISSVSFFGASGQLIDSFSPVLALTQEQKHLCSFCHFGSLPCQHYGYNGRRRRRRIREPRTTLVQDFWVTFYVPLFGVSTPPGVTSRQLQRARAE